PTVEAAAIQLAPTVEKAMSEIAPTVETLATQIAPTLEVMVTEAGDLIATGIAAATEVIPQSGTTPETGESSAQSDGPAATPFGGINEFLDLSEGQTGLSGLVSFQQTSVVELVSGNETGMIDYWGEFTTEPKATHGKVTLSGLAAGGLPIPTFEYVIIEEAGWVKIGRQPWIRVEDGVETLTGKQPYSADDFLFALPTAQRVKPDETIHGIACKHYVYSISDFEYEGGVIKNANGDIYTALDGGYIVRYTLQGEGVFDEFGGTQGIIDLTYEVFDVNSGINIQPPR
ncbi:MAG: hypothetical protein JXA42_13640, partial [Anaerolineales bacterium]|nr:hypothetical protein [Anaerolineales bacterium]